MTYGRACLLPFEKRPLPGFECEHRRHPAIGEVCANDNVVAVNLRNITEVLEKCEVTMGKGIIGLEWDG